MNPLRTTLPFSIRLLRTSFFGAFVLFTASAIASGKPPSKDAVKIIDTFSGEVDSGGIPKGWKPFELPKKHKLTKYCVQADRDEHFLKAEAVEAASAIFKELHEDTKEYPVISWRWKVEGTLKKGDETKKEGDDYAARVYVTFEYQPEKTSVTDKVKYAFLETFYGMKPPGNAINYIWANRLGKNETAPNVFTDKVMMIAVESGSELAGKWVSEERNIYEDYRKAFGEEPPKIAGIVLMTDTDNTKESAVAYYDDLILKKSRF